MKLKMVQICWNAENVFEEVLVCESDQTEILNRQKHYENLSILPIYKCQSISKHKQLVILEIYVNFSMHFIHKYQQIKNDCH